jgi:shikimate kinase
MATFRTSQPGSAADPSRPHLILVGLPGSGKSTVAGMLARRLGRTFLDFDVEISRREGLSVAEIFAQRGEPVFRQLEHALTEEVAHFGGMVLAPGGGWVTQADTVALLRPTSRMVYLKISPAGAIRRMGKKVAGRPLLLRPDPRGELERLLATRRSAYESADLIVDVEHLDTQRVADQIQHQIAL